MGATGRSQAAIRSLPRGLLRAITATGTGTSRGDGAGARRMTRAGGGRAGASPAVADDAASVAVQQGALPDEARFAPGTWLEVAR